MPDITQDNTPVPATATSPPTPSTPDELLDWDACIEVAPPRPTRRIQVRLRDLGRDKPQPIEIADADNS